MIGKREPTAAAAGAPWLLLGLATFSQVGMSLCQQGVAVLAVFVRQDLHLSLAQMGLLVSAMSIGVVAGQILSGLVIDGPGPRWVLFWGTSLAVVVAVLLSLVTTFTFWLGGLALLGVFLASFPSSGARTIFGAFDERLRGLVMGIRQTGVPVGSALAAALLPIFVAGVGLHRVWFGIAALLAVAGGLFLLAMPRWRRPVAQRGGSGSLSGMWGPMAVALILVSAQYSALAFMITNLQVREGWSIGAAGLGLALIQVGGGMGRIGLGWWSDRIHRRGPVIAGLALLASVMAFVVGRLPSHAPGLLVVPILWLLGVGGVGWNGLSLTWAGERVGAARAGRAMSWTGSAAFLGSALYPPLFGSVVDHTHRYSVAWTALGVWLLVGFAIALVLSLLEERRRGTGLDAAR
ncbi:MAG: MFS transporter [Clostridia bacterium]